MDNLSHIEKLEIVKQMNHILNSPQEFEFACEKTFKDADQNNDDFVDKDELEVELMKMAKAFGLPEPNKDTVELILLKYDVNHNKNLDRKEWACFFKNALENFEKLAEKHLHSTSTSHDK